METEDELSFLVRSSNRNKPEIKTPVPVVMIPPSEGQIKLKKQIKTIDFKGKSNKPLNRPSPPASEIREREGDEEGSDEEPDTVKDEDRFCALVVGPSGAGKSTLTKALASHYAARYNRDVYILNQRGGDLGGFKRITWDQLHHISHAVLIIGKLKDIS